MRRVDTAGVITTVAGNGTAAFNGNGLRGVLTALSAPAGIAVDRCGNLLIADGGYDRIRRLSLASSCTPPAMPSAENSEGRGFLVLLVAGLAVLAVVGAVVLALVRRGAGVRP